MPPSTTAPRRLYRKHSLRLVVCWAALSALAAAHAQDDEAAAAGKTASVEVTDFQILAHPSTLPPH